MSEPTQAGAQEAVGQTTEIPEPSWSAYSPQQLLKIINKGVTEYRPGHPQHGEARVLVQQARTELARQLAEQNHREYVESHDLGPVAAGITHFGDVASLGLLGQNSPIPFLQGAIDPKFLQASNEQHGLASLIGGGLGGLADMALLNPLAGAAGLGAIGSGAAIGTGLGAAEGALHAEPGKRERGAVIGGVTGLASGTAAGVGGRVLGGVARGVGKLLGNAAPGALSKSAAKAAEVVGKEASAESEMIGGKSIAEIRAALTKQKYGTPEQIEQAIQGMSKQQRVQSGGVTTELPAEKLSPIAGTEGRGFEVTGERAMPPAPNAPTVAEIQERLGQARARFEAHGFSATPGELPQPSGGATLTPKGAAPAADPTEPFPTARRITGTLQQAEEKAGRPLLPEEKEKVLAANAAKLNVQQFGKERAVLADVERRMGRPLTQEEKRQVLKKLLGDYTKTQPWNPATPE